MPLQQIYCQCLWKEQQGGREQREVEAGHSPEESERGAPALQSGCAELDVAKSVICREFCSIPLPALELGNLSDSESSLHCLGQVTPPSWAGKQLGLATSVVSYP